MNFLILVDNSFSNKYSKEFESKFLNKINSLKNNLNCDIKFIENKNIENLSIPNNVEFLKCKVSNNNIDLKDLLSKLFEKKITSILLSQS